MGSWERARTLVVVLVGPGTATSVGPKKGSALSLRGVFGLQSAPSTCGIPPGVAGDESVPGDCHTFLFLLDLVSRCCCIQCCCFCCSHSVVAVISAAALAAGMVAGSAVCGWSVLSAAAPVCCGMSLLLAVTCCCRSRAGLSPWGC